MVPVPSQVLEIPSIPICYRVITSGGVLFPENNCNSVCAGGGYLIQSDDGIPRKDDLAASVSGCQQISHSVCGVEFFNCFDPGAPCTTGNPCQACPPDEYSGFRDGTCFGTDAFDPSTGCCAPIGNAIFPRCFPGFNYDIQSETCVPGAIFIVPPPPTPPPPTCSLICTSPGMHLDLVACRCVDPPVPGGSYAIVR